MLWDIFSSNPVQDIFWRTMKHLKFHSKKGLSRSEAEQKKLGGYLDVDEMEGEMRAHMVARGGISDMGEGCFGAWDVWKMASDTNKGCRVKEMGVVVREAIDGVVHQLGDEDASIWSQPIQLERQTEAGVENSRQRLYVTWDNQSPAMRKSIGNLQVALEAEGNYRLDKGVLLQTLPRCTTVQYFHCDLTGLYWSSHFIVSWVWNKVWASPPVEVIAPLSWWGRDMDVLLEGDNRLFPCSAYGDDANMVVERLHCPFYSKFEFLGSQTHRGVQNEESEANLAVHFNARPLDGQPPLTTTFACEPNHYTADTGSMSRGGSKRSSKAPARFADEYPS